MSPTTPRSAADVIRPAFEHTKRQLFRPFRLGQWLRLGFVGILAGEGGSSNCNVRLPWNSSSPPTLSRTPPVPDFHWMLGPQWQIKFALGMILVLIVMIVFLWISSRMRFVLFDSVVSGECHVRAQWRRRKLPGWHYFVFQLLFTVGSLLLLGLCVGGPIAVAARHGWFTHPAQNVAALVFGGLFLLVTFLAIVVVVTVIGVLIKDFVVPQMALDGITVSEGWRHLSPMMRADAWSYAGYIGLKCLLAIVYGIAFIVVVVIAFFVLLVPMGGIGALAVASARAAALTWNPLTIGFVVIDAGFALALMCVVASIISAPGMVFFPAYSMYFFADRYPALAAALPPPAQPLAQPPPQT
jgi:hypothetical protein